MTRITYTADERKARLESASDRLTQAVESITTGEDWQRYLGFASQLPHYSARNVFMLMNQAVGREWDSLGAVAGYRKWQAMGRQVQRGECGLVVLAPCKYRREDEETGAVAWIVRGFTLATVFEVRQTEGEELPAPVRPELLTGDGPDGAWSALVALIEARGFTVSRGPLSPANGTTDMLARTVTVADRLEGAAAVKTAIHEYAHCLMHDGPICDYLANRGRCEAEAESVAYLVCDALGLATDQYSFAYVAHWSKGDTVTVIAAADRAVKVAGEVLADLVGTEATELVNA